MADDDMATGVAAAGDDTAVDAAGADTAVSWKSKTTDRKNIPGNIK